MSATPDPTDAKADGNFGSAGGSHRAGYGDRLANAEKWARKGGTLNAGEGAILCEEIDRLRDEIQRIKRGIYKEALDDMRQLAAPLFAELEQRKEGAMIDEIKYENVVREFDYDSFTMGEEIVRLRKRLAAIETLHKQWVVKFLSGHGRSRGAQQIIDALTEILHKKEDA